jgi:hypothetical protein
MGRAGVQDRPAVGLLTCVQAAVAARLWHPHGSRSLAGPLATPTLSLRKSLVHGHTETWGRAYRGGESDWKHAICGR